MGSSICNPPLSGPTPAKLRELSTAAVYNYVMLHLYSRCKPNRVGCNLWQGHTSHGYAVIRIDGKQEYVHRLTYQREHGTVPKRLRNTCGRPNCINPWHWEDSYLKW